MKTLLRATLLATALAACGDDSAPRDAATVDSGATDGSTPDPAAAACEEIDEPGSAITAGAAADDTAPIVEIGAEPYRVTLPASGSGFARVVTTEPETTAIAFFRASGVLTRILESDGATEVPLASAGANEACEADIPEHFDLDFEEPGTYYLELTSASAPWFFLSSAEGHAHMQ
jgi:hypothetical protein